jgi:RNA polymerase sigma factor (sigma-70 family)
LVVDTRAPATLIGATMDVVPELSADDLWRAHADELLRFATVLAGPNDAYDVVADAMLGAAAAATAPTVINRRAYLFRAVANRARDEHRRRQRRWRRDLAAVGPATAVQPDNHSDVRRAVAELSVQQRAVVYLAYWEDLPEREIAEVLGVSPGTVHRTLQRARETLREALR